MDKRLVAFELDGTSEFNLIVWAETTIDNLSQIEGVASVEKSDHSKNKFFVEVDRRYNPSDVKFAIVAMIESK